jgi:hypothetical protein
VRGLRRFWLASYPKSGSTWFRLLVANLTRTEPADINRLPPSPAIASLRETFDNLTLIPSGLLTHEECDLLRPEAYRAMARMAAIGLDEPEDGVEDATFVKTHDAWTNTAQGQPLLGGEEAAAGAILIVRDPRDIVASLASHHAAPLDDTIDFMGDRHAVYCGRTDRLSRQLRQRLLDWSGFNASWLDQCDIPVHLIRYEDMKEDAAGVLARALAFAGVKVSPEAVERAARFAQFDGLKTQELASGFAEAPRPDAERNFFRKGVAGGWHEELSAAQAARIESRHAAMMARLDYQIAEERRRCA